MKQYQSLALLLVVIGAVNWGLIGLVGVNVVSALFGAGSAVERVVYVLVGLGGAFVAWNQYMATGKKR